MNTSRLIVKDLVDSALSNADGVQLQIALDQMLANNDNVIVSFHDINTISSSFLNSSIGNIVDQYGINILSRIKIVDYTPPMAAFLRKYTSDLKSLSAL